MRRKRPLARTEEQVRDTSLVVIASEDHYAVRQYFDFFRSPRIQFRVLETSDGQSSPQHVLNRLSEYMEEYEMAEGDQLWLVLDTDHWIEAGHIANLTKVVRESKQKGIEVAISNPCFDLWLLLHFAEFPTEPELACDTVGQKIRDTVGSYNKTKVYNLPITIDAVVEAISRAKANFDAAQVIPTKLQTAVFLLLDDLVARQMVSIPGSEGQ